MRGATRERQLRFPAQPASENSQLKLLRQPLEQAFARDPSLAQDQAVRSVAMKNSIEVIDHGLILDAYAGIADQAVRQSPIVVPATAVFPVLDLLAADAPLGEMFHGALDGLAIRLR